MTGLLPDTMATSLPAHTCLHWARDGATHEHMEAAARTMNAPGVIATCKQEDEAAPPPPSFAPSVQHCNSKTSPMSCIPSRVVQKPLEPARILRQKPDTEQPRLSISMHSLNLRHRHAQLITAWLTEDWSHGDTSSRADQTLRFEQENGYIRRGLDEL